MSSSPPPAGTGEETFAGEAAPALHAAETGAGGDVGSAAPASDEEADGEEGDAMEEDGSGSDDNDMEVGEEVDEEDDTADLNSGSSQEPDDEQFAAQKEELIAFATKLEENEKKAAADGDSTETEVGTCCICMKPWTSDGAHRICCIPCGHVHGRSCLVKWLRRCGGTTAKCPQCSERFGHQSIINLYAPEDLWNEGIRDKKVARFTACMVHMIVDLAEEAKRMRIRTSEDSRRIHKILRATDRNNKWLAEMSKFRGEVASLMEKMNSMMSNSNGGTGADPAALTPGQMLEFLSRSWPKLPPPHRP